MQIATSNVFNRTAYTIGVVWRRKHREATEVEIDAQAYKLYPFDPARRWFRAGVSSVDNNDVNG